MGDSNTGQTYGMTTFSRTSSTGQSSSWPHSPPQGCYPAIYGQSRLVPSQGQPSTSGFGYYGHTQNFNSAAGSAGTVPGRQAQDEPHFPFISTGFSPPPGSPTYYPGGCGSIQSFQQQSPFQQGPYVQPHQEPFQQPHQTASASPQGMTGIRRHSEGSIPQPVLQNPSQDPVSSHYTASPLTSTHHETPWLLSSSDTDSRDTESTSSRLPHQTSTLQALLEAPTTSTCLDLRSPPLSVASSNMVRRTVSVDSNPVAFIRRGMEPGIMNIGQFKLPDKRLSSNGDSCGMSVLGHSDVSAPALSSLFNLVENVDPLGGTSSPTPTLVPTPTSTPTSTPTPTSASSPSIQSKDEEVKTYMDLSSGQVKVSPRPSPVPNIESRMLMEEALPLVAAGENMSPSVTLWRYTGSIIDDALLEQADMELVSPSNCSSRESIASAPVVGARKIENDRLGKQVRMKKLGFSHQRMLMHGSGEGFTALTSPSSSSLYTYTFHVPTPVFKRLKLQSIYPHREPDVKLVHMHPKDARRYSLLKIGRELVRLTRLSAREIANISNALRVRGASRSATERPHSPHNSLVDPQTGEVLMSRIQSRSTSSMLPENKSGSVVIMQSSRLPGTSRQLGSKSKRLLGPRCKRLKKFSDAKCQTVVSALESTVPPGPQSGGEGVYEMRPEQIHLHSKSSHLFSYSSGQKGTKKQSDVSVHSVSPATKTNELVLSMPSQSPLFTSGWKQPSSVKSEIGADDQQSKFLPNPGVPGPGQYSDQWNSDSNHSHSGGSWRMESPQGVPKPWSEGSGQLGNGGTWQSGCYLGWQPQYPGVKSEREHMQNRIRPDANSGLVSSPNTCLSSSWSAPVSPSVSLASFNSTMLSSSSSRPLAASFCESPTVTSVPVQQTGVSSTRVHYTHSYGTYTPVHYSHPSPEEFTEDSYASQMGSQKSYHDGCSTYSLHDSQTGSQTTFGSPTHYSSFMGSGYLEGQHNQFSPPGTQHCQFFPAGQGDQHTTCLPLNRSVHYPASGSSHTATYQSTQNTLHSIGAHGHNAGGQPGNFMVQQKGFPAYSQAGSQNNFSPDTSQHEKYSSSAGQPPNGSPQCPVPANSSESWQHESQTQDSSANGNSSKLFLDHSNQLQPFLQKGACQDTNTAASDLAREPATSFLKSQSICPVRPVISIGAVPVPSPMLTSYQELENSSQQLQSLSPTIPPSQHRAEQPRNFHGSFVNSHPPVKLRNSEGSAVESSDDDDEEGARASRSRKNRTKISQSVVKTYNCMSDVTPKELSYNLQIVNHGQRKVTLEMFSTDESEGDETDDSSDEYIPSSSSRLRGTKRKKRRKAEKRAKRMSVNYSRNAFSHFLEEKEQRKHRRGRSRKRHQQRSDHKDDKLIEGIHYIIVGKFKGHRVMLVKVHKVKVGLNERVVVSKWLASREGSKMKDVCYRSPDSPTYFSKDTSNESTHADKHFFHTGTQDDPECLSDASTIIGDFGQTVGTSDETAEQKIPMEIPYTREGESKDGAYSHGKNNCLHRENREATGCTVHSANREKGGLRDQSLKHTLGSCKDMHENLLNGSGSVVSMLSPQAPGTFSDGCVGNRGAAGMIKEIIDCDGKISFRHEVDEGNGEVEKQQDGVSVSRQCEGVLSVYGALEKMVTTEDTETSAAGREKWELSALTKSASMQNSVQDPAVLQKIKKPFSDHRNPSGSAACHSCSESSLTLKQNLSREALNSGRPKSKLMSTKGKKPKMNKSAEKSKKKFVSEDLLSIRESSKDILLSEAKLGRKLLKAARENCSFQVQESKCTSLLKQCAANNFIFKQGTAPESLEPCQHELESRRKAPVDWGPGVTMPGKLPTDSPFVVSQPSSAEHSQDADCSSLPHSSPDSDSSLPAFPCISFTNSLHPTLKDKHCNDFSKSGSRKCEKEKKDSERQSPSVVFHPQKQSCRARLKEANTSQQDKIADSSDSSDSNACFSSGSPARRAQSFDTDPASFSMRTKLELKEINKKQKQLTPNQRLGVAFLSKKSRRKKKSRTRAKNKKAATCGTGKLMNSLSLLHMATLANLSNEQPAIDHKENSLPHYCDRASDHTDDYQDSLHKMSYISPLSSDKGDSSPPTPASPSDLQHKRGKCRSRRILKPAKAALVDLRSDENLGTEPISISQLMARTAREAKIKQCRVQLQNCWPPLVSEHPVKRKPSLRDTEKFARDDLPSETSPAYKPKIPSHHLSSQLVVSCLSHSNTNGMSVDCSASCKPLQTIQTSHVVESPNETGIESQFSLHSSHHSSSGPVVPEVAKDILPADHDVSSLPRAACDFGQGAEHLRTFVDVELSGKRYCDSFTDGHKKDEDKQPCEGDAVPSHSRDVCRNRSDIVVSEALGLDYTASRHCPKTSPLTNCTPFTSDHHRNDESVGKNGWHTTSGWSISHQPASLNTTTQGKHWQEHSTHNLVSTHKLLPAHSPHKAYAPVSPQKFFSGLSPGRPYQDRLYSKTEGKPSACGFPYDGREEWAHVSGPRLRRSSLEGEIIEATFAELSTSLQRSPCSRLPYQYERSPRTEEKLSPGMTSPKCIPTTMLCRSPYISVNKQNSEEAVSSCVDVAKAVDLSRSPVSPKDGAASERRFQTETSNKVGLDDMNENSAKADAYAKNADVFSRSLFMGQYSVCKTLTSTIAHPTWTSVKTDKFENITDDEDEDVIPPSQGSSSNLARFPSFKQLNAVVPVWVLPSSLLHTGNPGSLSANPIQALDRSSDKHQSPASCAFNLQSLPALADQASAGKSSYAAIDPNPSDPEKEELSRQVNHHCQEDDTDGCRAGASSQVLEKSYVSGIGTPWRESQMLNNTSTSITSNFEPITDSESEDEGGGSSKTKWQECDRNILLNSRYRSLGYSSSSSFNYHLNPPIYTAYTSLKSSLPYSHQLSQRFYSQIPCHGKMFTSFDGLSKSQPLEFASPTLGGTDSSKLVDHKNPQCLAGKSGDKTLDFSIMNALPETAQTNTKKETAYLEKLSSLWHSSPSSHFRNDSDLDNLAEVAAANSLHLGQMPTRVSGKDKVWQQLSGRSSLLCIDPEASSGGCGNDVDGQKDKDAFSTDSSPSKKYQPIDGNQPGSGSKQDWDDERSVGDPKHPQCILNRGPEDVGQDEKTTSSQQSPAKPYSSAAPPLSRGETQNLMEGSSGPVYVEHEPDHAMNLEPTQPEYVLRPQLNPPLREALEASCVSFGLSIEPVVKAFCSNPTDLPEKPR